jgi:hypothetical protein
MILALRCHGLHMSVTLMPPSLPVDLAGALDEVVEQYVAAPPAPLLYQPPYLSAPTPPPDACSA